MNEFLVLFILKIKSLNIYEIKKYIDTNLAPFVEIGSGALIPLLKRLEKNGYIKGNKQMTDGGLKRSFYSILPEGESYFEELLAAPIGGAYQLAGRELEVLQILYTHEIFSAEQKILLKEKIANKILQNINVLKKQITLNKANTAYFKLELECLQKKLQMLSEVN